MASSGSRSALIPAILFSGTHELLITMSQQQANKIGWLSTLAICQSQKHLRKISSGRRGRLKVKIRIYQGLRDAVANSVVERLGTTHWPNARHLGTNIAKRDGAECPHNRSRPSVEPQLTERGFKLTGIPYIIA